MNPTLNFHQAKAAVDVPEKFYRRWCIYGRSNRNLIASVALRAPAYPLEFPAVGPRNVVLDEVWTHRKHRNQGHATDLLRVAQAHALRASWAVYCRPLAHDGGPGPDQEDLFRFYRERDFEMLPTNPQWLICPPF